MKILRGINGFLRHVVRDISVKRVMHLTQKVGDDIGDLRDEAMLFRLMRLVTGVEKRGVKVLMVQALSNHVHMVVMPTSRKSLHDAMRYLFSKLARAINTRMGRKGTVFPDRFASRVARSAVDLFNVVAYVARNPKDAGLVVRRDYWDRGLWFDARAFVENDYLNGVFGTCEQAFMEQLWQMRSDKLTYRRLPDVRQLTFAM